MSENTWDRPNDIVFAMKCTTSEYAQNFVERGQIKFSTPQSWERYAVEGRGDKYEGTLAYVSKGHSELCDELLRQYPGSYALEADDKLLIKSPSDMSLPCFCLYGLKVGDFPPPDKAGWTTLSTHIDGRYFQSFADFKSAAPVEAMPENDRPAVVVIKNIDICFLEKVKSKLRSLGIEDEQIMVDRIHYRNFTDGGDKPIDIGCAQPGELFVKRKEFEYQQEIRIVINTDDSAILRALERPIEIGNLSNTAQVIDEYLDSGIRVEARFNAYKVSD